MRKFQTFNHPEPDEDGVQRYSVHELIADARFRPSSWVRVADDLTAKQADAYVREHGEYDA